MWNQIVEENDGPSDLAHSVLDGPAALGDDEGIFRKGEFLQLVQFLPVDLLDEEALKEEPDRVPVGGEESDVALLEIRTERRTDNEEFVPTRLEVLFPGTLSRLEDFPLDVPQGLFGGVHDGEDVREGFPFQIAENFLEFLDSFDFEEIFDEAE